MPLLLQSLAAIVVLLLLSTWVWATRGVVALFRAYDPKQPMPRIQTVDLLALMVFLQLPLLGTIVGLNSPGVAQDVAWGAGFGLVLFTLAIWWRGVEILSQRGITHSRRRFVLLSGLLPLYTAGSLLSVGVLLTSLNVMAFPQWWFPFSVALVFILSIVAYGMNWVSAGAKSR